MMLSCQLCSSSVLRYTAGLLVLYCFPVCDCPCIGKNRMVFDSNKRPMQLGTVLHDGHASKLPAPSDMMSDPANLSDSKRACRMRDT